MIRTSGRTIQTLGRTIRTSGRVILECGRAAGNPAAVPVLPLSRGGAARERGEGWRGREAQPFMVAVKGNSQMFVETPAPR
jgi:hypothetical protein